MCGVCVCVCVLGQVPEAGFEPGPRGRVRGQCVYVCARVFGADAGGGVRTASQLRVCGLRPRVCVRVTIRIFYWHLFVY